MLITITYQGSHTQDLGFLLHKNPYRPQCFTLSSGKAYVFYPEISDERTTAALLLEMNPIDLAKGKSGANSAGLFDYVNDRPYVCSSFMSSALARVFGTAFTGRCDKMQELADSALDLTACVYNLPCRGREELVAEIFEPLGYTCEMLTGMMDEEFLEWGKSSYITLTLRGRVRLAELLNHLYVLLPVFDKQKHYYVAKDEIEKLLHHGEGWLSEHPAKEKIIKRYFSRQKDYARDAISRLMEEVPEAGEAEEEEAEEVRKEMEAPKEAQEGMEAQGEGAQERKEVQGEEAQEGKEQKRKLNDVRLEAVKKAVLASGAKSVIDLGCGECRLTGMLLSEQQIERITAADVSVSALEKAKLRLHYDRLKEDKKNKLTLMQASLTYRDERFSDFDCACVVEVIEHIDPPRIPIFERVVFEFASPNTVILTTPNREYNVNYAMAQDSLRHFDHRFEWTREEFKTWAESVCVRFGYTVKIQEIGDIDETVGAPTQMGVFTKCR